MRVLHDADAELHHLDGKTVAIVGYGNQGRAQALNLRDSEVQVLVGSIRDAGAPALISGIISLTNPAVGVIVGWLLSAVQAALSAGLPADGSARVLQELKALSTQVTDPHGAVAQSNFEQLVAGTQDTLGKIDHAYSQLALLAKLPSTDTTRKNFAQTIQDYIGKNLIDAPEKLHQRLASNIPVAEGANIIKAASQAVGKQKRFFDEKSTASIKSVYDYYAVYPTQLAVLLANYWNSQPETYSAQVKTANLQRLQGYLADQKTLPKPAPARHTVIDTRTNKMWTRNFQNNPVDAASFCQYSDPKLVLPEQTNGPRTIPCLPFGNWQLPDETEFRTLIDGHGDAKPVQWLSKEAGMSQLQTDAPPAKGLAFMRGKDVWSIGCVGSPCFREVRIKRFDLWNDRIDTTEVGIGSCGKRTALRMSSSASRARRCTSAISAPTRATGGSSTRRTGCASWRRRCHCRDFARNSKCEAGEP